MRRLILSEFVSLDGVVHDPAGTEGWERGGWVFDHPDAEQAAYADQMNAMRKHVVSTTLRRPAWNNTSVIDGNVVSQVTDLKVQEGGDLLLVGSARLAQSLIPHGLIDEYRLLVFPVVLGGGTRLFADTPAPTALLPSSARTLPSGTTILTYQSKGH